MLRRSALLLTALLSTAITSAHAQSSTRTQQSWEVVPSIGYARAIRVGATLYVSGIVGRGTTLEEQLTDIYTISLPRVLQEFGAKLTDVVKETVYTTDMEALSAAIPARKRALKDHAPTATWVGVNRLLSPSAKLEIEFVVEIGSGKAGGK